MNLSESLKLLRTHQWAKNSFVAAPLFFTPSAVSPQSVLFVLAGVASFCALSSSVYIINDYADRRADRKHPKKRHRPLASATVSVPQAFVLFAVLSSAGFLGAYMLSLQFFLIATAYYVLNIIYSFRLKHVSILDLIVIAVSFVLRIESGAAVIHQRPLSGYFSRSFGNTAVVRRTSPSAPILRIARTFVGWLRLPDRSIPNGLCEL